MPDVTSILSAIEQGDPHAAEQLLPLVYNELRGLAAQKLAQEKPGQTLQATALVHDAYLRLVAGEHRDPGPGERRGVSPTCSRHWDSRRHFFAAAAEAMRRILVENARRKGRVRHGGGRTRQELNEQDIASPERSEQLLAVDEAMDRLANTNPQAAELVKLRFFAGCTNAEAASLLGISPRKANQVWSYARAWLLEEIGAGKEA